MLQVLPYIHPLGFTHKLSTQFSCVAYTFVELSIIHPLYTVYFGYYYYYYYVFTKI